MDLHAILPRVISAILSWLDSANLRNRMYYQSQRIEELELLVEDIERMNCDPKIDQLIKRSHK